MYHRLCLKVQVTFCKLTSVTLRPSLLPNIVMCIALCRFKMSVICFMKLTISTKVYKYSWRVQNICIRYNFILNINIFILIFMFYYMCSWSKIENNILTLAVQLKYFSAKGRNSTGLITKTTIKKLPLVEWNILLGNWWCLTSTILSEHTDKLKTINRNNTIVSKIGTLRITLYNNHPNKNQLLICENHQFPYIYNYRTCKAQIFIKL